MTHPQGQQWLRHFQESSPAASAHVWIWNDACRTPRSAPSAANEKKDEMNQEKSGRTLETVWKTFQHLTDLKLVLVHVDACVGVPPGMDGAHERVHHRWFRLMNVIGTVMVRFQTAQAGCGDVPGERTTVLLLIARVTRGGRERQREGEQEEKRQRPGMKPPSSRKCATVRVKTV